MVDGSPSEELEEFVGLWKELLRDASERGTAVLVEGERDERSLRALGISGRIVRLHRGQPLSELARDLAKECRRVIVLTDWDSAGGALAQKCKDLLSGVLRVDLEHRRRIALAVRGEVVHVEGLRHWAGRLADRSGASLSDYLVE